MHSTPVSVLLTRPRDAAMRFAGQLMDRLGHQITIVQSPLIEITALAVDLDLTDYEGVVFTSSNGVRFATDLSGGQGKTAYCVGTATTDMAGEMGWSAVHCGRDAQTLISAVSEMRPQAPLLHLHGVHTRGNVAEHLSENGVPTDAMAIYDQPAKPLSDEAISLLLGGTSVIVPLFSPRSAEQFCEVAKYSKDVFLIAMSEAVFQALTQDWRSHVQIAAEPSANGMLDAIEKQVIRLSRVERQDAGQ